MSRDDDELFKEFSDQVRPSIEKWEEKKKKIRQQQQAEANAADALEMRKGRFDTIAHEIINRASSMMQRVLDTQLAHIKVRLEASYPQEGEVPSCTMAIPATEAFPYFCRIRVEFSHDPAFQRQVELAVDLCAQETDTIAKEEFSLEEDTQKTIDSMGDWVSQAVLKAAKAYLERRAE